ncbi:MAG: TlpA disulfide reductase family protein [Corynebacterium sp.]|nr:TlpA disulfide reductase family protein [Corynebacterium sp.]
MNRSAKWSIIGAIILTVCIVAAVPMLLRTVNDAGEPEASTASISIEQRPDCAGDFPVDLPCLGGERIDAAAKVTVVNVWAWWCEPCRDELPILEEYQKAYPDYRVIGVHADKNAANGAAMLNDLGVDMPSFQDDTGIFAGTLGLPGVVPVTVVLREDGTTAAVLPQVFTSREELEHAVEEALQ